MKNLTFTSYTYGDEFGNQFPVLTDYHNCDVRILNYETRNYIKHIPYLLNNGITKYLAIFTNETEDEIVNIINEMKESIEKGMKKWYDAENKNNSFHNFLPSLLSFLLNLTHYTS